MASMKASLHAGLRFIEHLGERKKKTDKNELRDIYNSEFRRNRDGIKDPNFSNVLFALKKFNKAYGQRGKVYLDRKSSVMQSCILEQGPSSEVRVVYGDQWRRPSRQKPPVSAPPLANGGTTLPPAGAVPPPPPVQPGSQAKKRLANKILQNLKENR
ncbi:hypothetical protein COCON_G00174010 [Conger conger]|uniref:Helicase MOV-10 N-terminal domain-containing protein n=2 Tax=Conger conger TaxID=82655 RepID=A0A9Q1HSF9_CONCO|nr:hypothetical protein COCON_G00174010 [Conger conger]